MALSISEAVLLISTLRLWPVSGSTSRWLTTASIVWNDMRVRAGARRMLRMPTIAWPTRFVKRSRICASTSGSPRTCIILKSQRNTNVWMG